jgi:hypothetical protein
MGYKFRTILFSLASVFAPLAVAQTPPQVQVQSLQQVEPFRVGPDRGIPYIMPREQWRGTRAAIAARLMSDLPEFGASPLLNRLAVSVLVSPSVAPSGGATDKTLASLRMASIYRLGQLQAVITLAERSPGGLSDPENAAIATRAFLALGQESNACETAIRLQEGRDAVFWLKIRAFCLAREGRRAAAELTADLVLEADPDDIDFMLALDQMLKKKTAKTSPVTALELAMARFSGAEINADGAPFSLIQAFAETPGPTGLEASRKIAATGLLPPQTLAKTYQMVSGLPERDETQDETSSEEAQDFALLAQALKEKGAKRAALIYQSAERALTPTGRLRAINAGLGNAQTLGGFFAAAHLYAPLLSEIAPERTIPSEAMQHRIAYALLIAGKAEQAKALLAADDREMQRLMVLAAPVIALPKDALGEDVHTQKKTENLAFIDLMALYALGAPLDDEDRDFLFNHVTDREEFAPCRPGALSALDDGARNKARAASFLRAALMLADSGFDGINPQCGATVIRAFKTMGYDVLARQAALEMMLAPRLSRVQAKLENEDG